MSLTERINEDIKNAMKAKEKERLAALRDIKSKLLIEATSGADATISEEVENKIVMKLYKQRIDTYELYVKEGREDLAADEKFQAEVIKEYMPAMLSEDDLRKMIEEKLTVMGAKGMQDLSKVMGPIMGQLSGKADGKLIADLVKQSLSK
jgi:uncharacterized protein YqeY